MPAHAAPTNIAVIERVPVMRNPATNPGSTACATASPVIASLRSTRKFPSVPQATSAQSSAINAGASTASVDCSASALDVAAMGLYRKIGFFHRVSGRWKAEARRALALVDMENFADMPIGELSGGQQQRVLLARSLAQGADLLMLDEPFVNVDFATAERLGAILRLACARGMTVFAVHHDLGDVRRFFDEAVLFDGTVVAHGPIEVALADAKLHEAFRLGPPPQEQLA